MNGFLVTTDSGCDLPMSLCREKNIRPLQLSYEIDGELILDTMDHGDCHLFYEKMREGKEPHTAQITPQQFYEFWKGCLEEENLPIVHICLGSGISGTWQNSIAAREMILEDFPGAEIYLVDSLLASVGYGMLAIRAAEMRDAGSSPAECKAELDEMRHRINTYYTTGDLTYLYRSGRVSKTGMVIAHALNIWPILNLDAEGHLIVTEKERGKKKTIRRIHKIIEELCIDPKEQILYVCHSDIPEEAREFGEGIKEEFGFKDVYYTYIGCTIGSHSGPGLVAAFFCGKPRTMP